MFLKGILSKLHCRDFQTSANSRRYLPHWALSSKRRWVKLSAVPDTRGRRKKIIVIIAEILIVGDKGVARCYWVNKLSIYRKSGDPASYIILALACEFCATTTELARQFNSALHVFDKLHLDLSSSPCKGQHSLWQMVQFVYKIVNILFTKSCSCLNPYQHDYMTHCCSARGWEFCVSISLWIVQTRKDL